MKKIVVMVSGEGTNLQAIIDAVKKGTIVAEISLVVTNKDRAYGGTRANDAGILVEVLKPNYFSKEGVEKEQARTDYMKNLVKVIKERVGGEPDLIVLAGWLIILTSEFIDSFKGKIINLHPALPGQFDGLNSIKRAYRAHLEEGLRVTGVMVHEVVPKIDSGRVIVSEEVPILAGTTFDEFKNNMHEVEHRLIVKAVKIMLEKNEE